MNGEGSKDIEMDDEAEVIIDSGETVVLNEDSVEINVEELVADIEASDGDDAEDRREAKKRLDALEDQLHKDDEFGSTYNFDLEEDLPT